MDQTLLSSPARARMHAVVVHGDSGGDDADFSEKVRTAMAEVTRHFAHPASMDQTLGAITATAVSLIPGRSARMFC